MAASYTALTEGPGGKLSPEGADMLYTRYHWASGLASGKRVLEVGCGPGLGLGLLRDRARMLVGGDFDGNLLGEARRTYGSTPLARLDAQYLPFCDDAFDLVLFFEGSYYVPDMDRVFDEFSRVVAPDGGVLFVNANPEREDFIPSPLSVHYHSADQFQRALSERGMSVEVMGAFPVGRDGLGSRVFPRLRRIANRLGLIPKTLRGRTLLKRLVQGRLVDIPREVEHDYGTLCGRETIPLGASARDWKVLYVEARAG